MDKNIKLRCPHCQWLLTIPGQYLGEQIKCKHCAQSLTVVLPKKAPTPSSLTGSTVTKEEAIAKMKAEQFVTISHPIRLGFALAFGFWLFTLMPLLILLVLIALDLSTN